MTKNEKTKEECKTAQFHYRCTAKRMEKIKKEAAARNITVQEYFDNLIARDIGLISSQMDIISYQLNELKKSQNLIYLNTDFIGKYLDQYLMFFFSRLEDFKSDEIRKKAYDKAEDRHYHFRKRILDAAEKDDKTFLYSIFGNYLKDDNFLAELYSRLIINTKNG